MLTAIELENFKGIGDRQRIEFAPLTLLFGANSAGKSTILQALVYLHELIERGAADVDRTELGGSVLELGGFARLVHQHDTTRSIVVRAEFATPGRLERFGRDVSQFPFPDLEDDVASAWIELTVSYRRAAGFRGPIVDKVRIGVNGNREPLVWLEAGTSLRDDEPLLARINLGHPLLATETKEIAAFVKEDDGSSRALTVMHAPAGLTQSWSEIAIPEDSNRTLGDGNGFGDGSGFGDGRSLPLFVVGRGRMSALPSPTEPLRIFAVGGTDRDAADLVGANRRERAAEEVRAFLEMIVLGTTAQLANTLRDSPYIGPLRVIPSRGALYAGVGRSTSWANGLAAWDLLLANPLLVERTNRWLARLNVDARVVVQELRELGVSEEDILSANPDKIARRLLLDTRSGAQVLPSELGAGISQLIPVIVAAVRRRAGLIVVEQPELHVHPAVQVGLGDLLIEAATDDRQRRMLLIETHSEHLILRVLRRIRETTEGTRPHDAPAFSDDKLSVLYVESTPYGTRVRRLRVDENGEFLDRWPKGFFAERMEELL